MTALWKVLDSTFLQTLVVLGIGLYTIKKVFPDFLRSQKSTRLDRLNYDDTLLSQAKSLDSNISACIHNAAALNSSCNALQNMAGNIKLTASILAQSVDSFQNSLILPPRDNSETRKDRISRILHVEGNTIFDWLTKFEQDTSRFNSIIHGQFEMLKQTLLLWGNDQVDTEKLRRELAITLRECEDYFWLVRRHRKPMNLFSEIVSEIATITWDASGEWSSEKINAIVGNKLKTLGDFVRNILGVYETAEKGVFLSYITTSDQKKRWKITIDEKYDFSVTQTDDQPSEGAKLCMLPNDAHLVACKENGTGYIEYIEKLIGP